MKRLIVTISGEPASPAAIRGASRAASRDWSSQHRPEKASKKRKHRTLTDEQREEKRLRTERNKIRRQANRFANEHDMAMRRLKRLADREAREADRARRRFINVRYKKGREPNFAVVCPKALFRRTHREAESSSGGSARVAADGVRNVVLKFASCRGFGRKSQGARAYSAGEAGRLARYICRIEGIEHADGAVMTNVIAAETVRDRSFTVDQMQRVVGFMNALEEVERATGPAHVYQHVILALPVELGPDGRAEALARFCSEFGGRNLPFVATLHKPDPGGDHRNFHAHIVLCARPFEYVGDYEWSFEAEKFTELTSKAMWPFLRDRLADAINTELKAKNSPLRYSGVPEKKRTGKSADGSAKGQKETAKERAAAHDDAASAAMISDLASCIQQLQKRVATSEPGGSPSAAQPKTTAANVDKPSKLPKPIYLDDLLGIDADQKSRVGGVEQNQPLPGVVAEKTAVAMASPSSAVRDVPVSPTLAPAPTRVELIDRSLSIFNAFHISPEVEALAKALKREPSTIALAVYEGRLQIAFNDRSLNSAAKSVAANPLMEVWLKRLAATLRFDHAAVPRSWAHVSVHMGQQSWVLNAELWAMTHGGVSADTSATRPMADRSTDRSPSY